MNLSILSERLDLVPLTPEFLRAMLRHDLAEAERILGFPLPDGLLDSTDVMALRLEQLESNPSLQPWLLRALVLRERRVMVGHIGFHTAPGADYLQPYAPNGVEFGFTVYAPFLRQGYAREASITRQMPYEPLPASVFVRPRHHWQACVQECLRDHPPRRCESRCARSRALQREPARARYPAGWSPQI